MMQKRVSTKQRLAMLIFATIWSFGLHLIAMRTRMFETTPSIAMSKSKNKKKRVRIHIIMLFPFSFLFLSDSLVFFSQYKIHSLYNSDSLEIRVLTRLFVNTRCQHEQKCPRIEALIRDCSRFCNIFCCRM